MNDEPPLSNSYQAADWLRDRHLWLDELVTRVCGRADDNPGWLDELVEAFNDIQAHGRAWEDYQAHDPVPSDEEEWYRWQAQGSRLSTTAGWALDPMSSGEIRLLRLMTTLSADRCESGWSLDDLSFDERGWAVVQDWTTIVATLTDEAQARIQDFHLPFPRTSGRTVRDDGGRARPRDQSPAGPDL